MSSEIERSGPERRGGGTGRLVRFGISLQVLLVLVLAVVVCGLAIWVTRRPPLHQRFDLTAEGRGSLSPEVEALCKNLPDEVTVDLFFTPPPPHLSDSVGRAQAETRYLLKIARSQFPTKFVIHDHDVTDVAEAEGRLLELGVDRQEDMVVLTRGPLRSVLRLGRDLAEIGLRATAPGQPAVPFLARFKGQEALGSALRELLQERAPTVYFSWGQDERDIESEDDEDLRALRRLLESDGFVVERWEPERDGPVPDDCDVLAVIAPDQPFTENGANAIRAYVAAGGRLVAAPSHVLTGGPGSINELLAEFGIAVDEGYVCRPYFDRWRRPVFEGEDCLDIRVSDSLSQHHAVTRPLWKQQQSVRFVRCRPLAQAPDARQRLAGVSVLPLAHAPGQAWVERPDANGRYTFALDGEDQTARLWLACVSEFLPTTDEARVTGADERPRSRVVAVGSSEVLASAPAIFNVNRGFLLNLFNWIASRDYLVTIDVRNVARPTVDVQRGDAVAVIQAASVFGLPGLCLLLGLFTWWRRSR